MHVGLRAVGTRARVLDFREQAEQGSEMPGERGIWRPPSFVDRMTRAQIICRDRPAPARALEARVSRRGRHPKRTSQQGGAPAGTGLQVRYDEPRPQEARQARELLLGHHHTPIAFNFWDPRAAAYTNSGRAAPGKSPGTRELQAESGRAGPGSLRRGAQTLTTYLVRGRQLTR